MIGTEEWLWYLVIDKCSALVPKCNLISQIQPVSLDYKENDDKQDQWNSAEVDNLALLAHWGLIYPLRVG